MAITPIVLPVPRPEDYNFTRSVLIPDAFRVTSHFIGFVVLIVPSLLLIRNRELGAVVFTVNTLLMNLYLFIQFFIWNTEDYKNWWTGEYYCDAMSYTFGSNLVEIIEVTGILVIMRNLAITVGDLRASPLTVKEKRYRNLVQLMIIVPLAIASFPINYMTKMVRYAIIPTVGCIYVYDDSWVGALFVTIIPLCIIVASVYYAVLTYLRFREIEKTAVVLRTRSTRHSVRAHRTRRRMYGMALTIAIPYFITNVVAMSTFISAMKFGPFSFSNNRGPLFNTAVLVPGWDMTWMDHHWFWVWSIKCIPIFWFFGLTKDAVNMYRKGALAMGLGGVFPGLHNSYDPDKSRPSKNLTGSDSWKSKISFTAIKNHLFDVSETDEDLPSDCNLPPQIRLSTFNPFSSVDTDIEKGVATTETVSNKRRVSDSDTAFQPMVSGALPASHGTTRLHPYQTDDQTRPYGPYRSQRGIFPVMAFRNISLPFGRKSRSKTNNNDTEQDISGSTTLVASSAGRE